VSNEIELNDDTYDYEELINHMRKIIELPDDIVNLEISLTNRSIGYIDVEFVNSNGDLVIKKFQIYKSPKYRLKEV